MSLGQWLYLVLLSGLWGGSFFFVGVAVHDLPTLTLVFLRVGLAALVLLPIVWWSGLALPVSSRAWLPFIVMAVLNNVIPFSMITLGQSEIASGLASVLNATTPLWTVLIAHALTRDEKLTRQRLAGVIIGVLGVAVLIGPAAILGQTSSVFGMLCVIAGTISYGFSGLWGRRLRDTPPLVSATCQLSASAMILLPVSLLVDQSWQLALPGGRVLGAIIGLAVLSTAAAYIVFFHIMRVSGPTNAMLVTLLIPVSGVLLGTVLLGEVLAVQHLAGGAIILCALVIFDGRLIAWLCGRRQDRTA